MVLFAGFILGAVAIVVVGISALIVATSTDTTVSSAMIARVETELIVVVVSLPRIMMRRSMVDSVYVP